MAQPWDQTAAEIPGNWSHSENGISASAVTSLLGAYAPAP